nr:CYP370C1 protein [Diaphanosoma celebensis]
MFVTTALIALLLGLGVYCLTKFSKASHLPPGPFNLPLVGYMPFLKPPIHAHFVQLSRKFGDIFSLNIGSYRLVVLSTLDSIRDAFKDDLLNGRPDFPFFVLRSDNKRGVILSEGKRWHELRRFTLRNLRDFGMGRGSIEAMVQEEVVELIRTLRADAGKPTQLASRFNVAVVNALWTITTGERFSHDDPAAMETIQQIAELIAYLSAGNPAEFMPFLSKLGPLKRQMEKRMSKFGPMIDFVMAAIDSHRASRVASEQSDFIDAFLDKMANEPEAESPFSGSEGLLNLKNVLIDLFMAGTETTSTSLLWLMLLLATHPEIQEKVQREIDAHVPRDATPSLEHRPKLMYTEAAIRESMRFASIVPLGVFHSATRDTEFRGYLIPKDTILASNIYQVHHCHRHWARPDEFYPDHFVTDDGALKTPEAFIPFAAGKRVCLGESLARMELYLFATALLQKFNFQLPAGQPPPSLEPVDGIVLAPKPFDVVLQLRQ